MKRFAMNGSSELRFDPKMNAAIEEMENLIREHYPEAIFSVEDGEDPFDVYLTVMIDVEDRDGVVDVFIDRLVDLHVAEELPLHVLPIRPPARNDEILRSRALSNRPTPAA